MNSPERSASIYKEPEAWPSPPGGPDLVPADKTRHCAVPSAEPGTPRLETQRYPPDSPLPPALPTAGLKEALSFGVLSTFLGE